MDIASTQDYADRPADDIAADQSSPPALSRGRKLFFGAFMLFGALLFAEAVLWFGFPVPPPYALDPNHPDVRGYNRYVAAEYPANAVFRGEANGSITPGIDGPVTISFNQYGFRGPELASVSKPADTLRVFCVGGSTTACLNLDDADTWPAQLQRMLAERFPDRRIEVVNCGVNAETTRGDINMIAHRVLPFAPDLVIMHPGINDWMISKAPDYSPARTEVGSYRSGRYEYLYRKLKWMGVKEVLSASQLFRRMVYLKRGVAGDGGDDDDWDIGGKSLVRLRRQQASRQVVPMTDELMQPRSELTDNLRLSMAMCRARGARALLLTQPVLWEDNMPDEHRKLCWMGFNGDVTYSPGDLEQMMSAYNAAMKGLADELGVPVVDAASVLPKDTSIFFDDCHFNVRGAERMAGLIADAIVQRGLLAGG